MICCAWAASLGRLRPGWSNARTIRPATRSSGFLGSRERYFSHASAACESFALPGGRPAFLAIGQLRSRAGAAERLYARRGGEGAAGTIADPSWPGGLLGIALH